MGIEQDLVIIESEVSDLYSWVGGCLCYMGHSKKEAMIVGRKVHGTLKLSEILRSEG